jgi:imidazolonepropionase-like amidohydrolase
MAELVSAGIKVAVSVKEDNFVRGLMWEASWQYATSKDRLSPQQTLVLVTWHAAQVADIGQKSGLLSLGPDVQLNMFSQDPILDGFESKLMVIVHGKWVKSHPKQF